jgi:hypothetical protein
MISAFIISALYLLGAKVFYEYDKEVVGDIPMSPAMKFAWVACWPVVMIGGIVAAALDRGEDE